MITDSVREPDARDREAVAEALATSTGPATGTRRRRGLHLLSVTVLVVGLAATAALATVSRANYLHNERREVTTQAKLAAAGLAVGPVDLRRRLGRATTIVAGTGKVALFDAALKGSVPEPFVGVRLFQMMHGEPRPVHALGEPTQLDTASAQAQSLLQKSARTGDLAVTRVATATTQRLGYAFAGTVLGQTYVAYAEQVLPGDRHADIPASSPLSNMVFALYYGVRETRAALLESNADDLPLGGDAARVTIPFGDQTLSAAMVPRSPLIGRFSALMPWLIIATGVLLTALMALLTERLARRRAVAEQLATVTQQLYATQRDVARTLQTALLPKHLPSPTGLTVATRYRTGTDGLEVGGDWYDLIDLPGDRVFFTVGDVSGRGLSAATMMSRLRHSIAAYATEGDDPAEVLAKVGRLIDVPRDGHFATALCGVLDQRTGVVTIANAGHPAPVLVAAGTAEPVVAPVEPPLGVGSSYTSTRLPLTAGATLLTYTDGLIERRDESLEVGLARLCHTAGSAADLEDLLDTVLATMVPDGTSEDDTAILALQWKPQAC